MFHLVSLPRKGTLEERRVGYTLLMEKARQQMQKENKKKVSTYTQLFIVEHTLS